MRLRSVARNWPLLSGRLAWVSARALHPARLRELPNSSMFPLPLMVPKPVVASVGHWPSPLFCLVVA